MIPAGVTVPVTVPVMSTRSKPARDPPNVSESSVPFQWLTVTVAPAIAAIAVERAACTSPAVASKLSAVVLTVVSLCVSASVKVPSVVGFVNVTACVSPVGVRPAVTFRGVAEA